MLWNATTRQLRPSFPNTQQFNTMNSMGRLTLNMSQSIDLIEVIFHPTGLQEAHLRLSTAVGWKEPRGGARQ